MTWWRWWKKTCTRGGQRRKGAQWPFYVTLNTLSLSLSSQVNPISSPSSSSSSSFPLSSQPFSDTSGFHPTRKIMGCGVTYQHFHYCQVNQRSINRPSAEGRSINSHPEAIKSLKIQDCKQNKKQGLPDTRKNRGHISANHVLNMQLNPLSLVPLSTPWLASE